MVVVVAIVVVVAVVMVAVVAGDDDDDDDSLGFSLVLSLSLTDISSSTCCIRHFSSCSCVSQFPQFRLQRRIQLNNADGFLFFGGVGLW